MRNTRPGEDGGEAARPGTLASRAYERLRHDILTGELAPGEKLRIRQLCERYGIGLSPMREALNRVSRDGFVRQTDLRGFSVAALSEADLEDLTRARCWVHEVALRQSIARGDSAWEEGVLVAYHRLSRVPYAVPVVDAKWEIAHRAFHASLIAACGSQWVIGFCEQLFDAADRYRHLSRAASVTHGPRRDEHRPIMEAAIAHDADTAVRLLDAHFISTATFGAEELRHFEREAALRRRPPRSAAPEPQSGAGRRDGEGPEPGA